jgi:hypothetical protein
MTAEEVIECAEGILEDRPSLIASIELALAPYRSCLRKDDGVELAYFYARRLAHDALRLMTFCEAAAAKAAEGGAGCEP